MSKAILVDGQEWFLLWVSSDVKSWIRTQDEDSWYEHRCAEWMFVQFDVSAELLTMIKLKFNHHNYKVL